MSRFILTIDFYNLKSQFLFFLLNKGFLTFFLNQINKKQNKTENILLLVVATSKLSTSVLWGIIM